MTLADAAVAMSPPIPRRELARRLKHVPPAGTQWGRRGRRAALYPIGEIFKAHAAWLRDRSLADDRSVCHNSALEECVRDEG